MAVPISVIVFVKLSLVFGNYAVTCVATYSRNALEGTINISSTYATRLALQPIRPHRK